MLRFDVGNIVKLPMVSYKCSLTTILKIPFFAIDNDTTKTKNLFRVQETPLTFVHISKAYIIYIEKKMSNFKSLC